MRSLETLLTTEHPRPARIRDWPRAWWLAVGAVCFGAFMGQLDASIVTLTYPSLEHRFDSSLAAVQWVSLAYLLALVALLVPIGRLSDTHGRKLVYLYGFVVFTAGSAACGLAPSLGTLIIFRIVQAVGAAMLQANSVALVRTAAPPSRLRAALGVQAAAQAVGLALGPTLGGVIVASIGWRWVFFINIPVGLVAVVLGYELLPRTRQSGPAGRLDRAGVVLLTAATTALLLTSSGLSGLPLPGWAVGSLAALALGAGAGTVRRLQRACHPLVPPALLRPRAVWAGLLGALGGYLVLFGPLVLVPVILSRPTSTPGPHLGTTSIGLVLSSLPVGFAVAATLAGRVLPRPWSDGRRGALGIGLTAAALAVLLVAPLEPGWLVPFLGLLGLGLGTFTPSNNAQVMGSIPGPQAGTGGGLVNMARSLGTALGVGVVTLTLHIGGARLTLAVLVGVAILVGASVLARPSELAGAT